MKLNIILRILTYTVLLIFYMQLISLVPTPVEEDEAKIASMFFTVMFISAGILTIRNLEDCEP